jgi:thiamine-phosphate pyrophosphorylase
MKEIDSLHYISQNATDGSQLTAIKIALDAGCKWIQLRIKNQSSSEIITQALAAKQLCLAYNAKLILNDYPVIAAEVEADGIHLGLADMSIPEAREIVGPRMIIGGTANTFSHVQQRILEKVDYIGLGPFRFTKTKEKLSPILGIAGYRSIFRQLEEARLSIPIIAIGGILPDDIPSLLELSIHGIAISGAITFADYPQEIVELITQIRIRNVENSR